MLHVNGQNISLDKRHDNSDMDFISHAHSDHTSAAKRSKCVIASDQTVALVEALYGNKINRPESLPQNISMLNSGHMLGSKQLCVDDYHKGERIVYTGDYQMQQSRVAEKIDTVQADTLIIDSTYPRPDVKFDQRIEVEQSMQKWTLEKLEHGIVLFTGYATGKAQEIIAIMNEVSVVPFVSNKIAAMSNIYSDYGIRLDYCQMSDNWQGFSNWSAGNFAAITNLRYLADIKSQLQRATGRQVFTAIATGFAEQFRFNTDVQFGLSDHADFWQATDYIDAVGAKQILTYGSAKHIFAANLKACGYNAMPFADGANPQAQLTVSESIKQ